MEGNSGRRVLLLVIVCVVLIAVIAGVAYVLYSRFYLHSAQVAAQNRFYIVSGSNRIQWYELEGSKVVPVRGPAGYDTSSVDILQTGTTMKSGDTPALIFNPPNYVQLVMMRGSNHAYIPYLKGNYAEKIGLADDSYATVFFSEYAASSSASGALSSGASSEDWDLMSVNLSTVSNNTTNIGPGFDPVATASGQIVAIAPEGLIMTNSSGSRSVLVNSANPVFTASAISPDGQIALLYSSTTQEFDAFSVTKINNIHNPLQATYLTSLKTPALGTAFLSPTTFIVESDAHTFAQYSISQNKITKTGTASI